MTNDIDDEMGAKAAMIAAAARERHLGEQHLAARRELDDLEARSGLEVASGDMGTARGFAKKLAETRETLGVVLRGIDAIRTDRRTAISEYRRSRALKPRAQEAECRKQAADLDAKAAPLLEELRGLQGVGYVPEFLPTAEQMNALGGGVRAPMFVQRPTKSVQLRGEADALARTAGEMERTAERVPASGEVEGASLSELVAAIFSDPARVGPRIPEVVEWVDVAVAAERRRLVAWHRAHPNAAGEAAAVAALDALDRPSALVTTSGRVAEEPEPQVDASVTFKLVWRDGQIDTAQSRALATSRENARQIETVDVIGGRR